MIGAELTADNHRMLYMPEGFARGFQTLADSSEVFYQTSEMYRPEIGARYPLKRFRVRYSLATSGPDHFGPRRRVS
ncbi:dTDP-4-dehydrorhamnose 3,5-epimerase family protein [Sulfuricaulis sp.]|jgi:dTDP-4-dehydrorhamnose 3,5-epimerase|uniref:dTDP-4-dehydrorhamnose 3,5-epimerase family protein n=1 Tax=Sulfuricaulis sp. TaxID=2003553 RepID=UPI00355A020A